MTSKLLLFEHSSFKISEAVGAQNFDPYSELVERHIHQSLCDDVLVLKANLPYGIAPPYIRRF